MINAIDFIKSTNKNNSDRVFLIDGQTGKEYTYSEIRDYSYRIAASLISKGLKKGDRIFISLDNSIVLAKLYFACLYSGIVVVPVNPTLSREQKIYIIKNSTPRLVITNDLSITDIKNENILIETAPFLSLGRDEKLINCFDNSLYLDLVNLHPSMDYHPFHGVDESDTLIIIYTSGTTSEPKGVVHSLFDLVNNAILFNATLDINLENRFYNNLSMTYLGGYYNLLLLPFVAQGSVVIGKTFNPESIRDFWSTIIKYKVNTLWLVPTVISILNEFDRGQTGIDYCKTNVKLILTGTAPLYENNRKRFEEKYRKNLLENFALSETLFLTTETSLISRKKGCVGKAIKNIQIKIVDQYLKNLMNNGRR